MSDGRTGAGDGGQPLDATQSPSQPVSEVEPAGEDVEPDCSLVMEAAGDATVHFVKQEVGEDASVLEVGSDAVAAEVSEQLAFNLAESHSRSMSTCTAASSLPLLPCGSLGSEGMVTSAMGHMYYAGASNFMSNIPGMVSSSNPFVFRQQKMRRDLSLLDKVRLIQRYDTSGKSQRALAAEFDISVGSVNNILRRKKEYLEAYQGNPNAEFFTPSKNFRKTTNPWKGHLTEINNYILKWIETARVKKVQVTSSIIQEKARDFARRIRLNNFIAPKSWVEGLKVHYNLQLGPDADQNPDLKEKLSVSWSKMLPFLIQGYEPENIFTCGETTLFFNAVPDKCFVEGGACLGSHHNVNIENHRVTVLLCCSAAGEKLSPFIICHANQGSSLTSDDVPLGFKSSQDALMTSTLFADWLRQLDSIMDQQNRRIALFMEMSPPHLGGLMLKNISLKFFLDGSTQFLQPLNLGIFTMFRAHYRKRFLQSVLAKAQDCDDIPGLLGSVGLVDALHWIKSAWDRVKPATVVNCFETIGFPAELPDDNASDMISPTLMELVEETGQMLKFTPMPTQMYLQFDSQFACHGSEISDWERQLLTDHLASLGRTLGDHERKESPSSTGHSRLSVDSDQGSSEPGPSVSQTEALSCLDRLKQFARSDSQLLDTLYNAEELLLDHITYRRRLARFHWNQPAHFPPPQARLGALSSVMDCSTAMQEPPSGASGSGARVRAPGLPVGSVPSDFSMQVYRAEMAHNPPASSE